jgi:hypothetical protein
MEGVGFILECGSVKAAAAATARGGGGGGFGV